MASLAQAAELAETEAGRLACAWMGEDAGDLRAVYPRQFAVDDLAARLREDGDALALQLGVTAEAAIRQRAARRVLGAGVSADTYARIDAEVAGGADPYAPRIAAAAA